MDMRKALSLDDRMTDYGMDPQAERLNMLPYPKGALTEGAPIDWKDWTAPQWLYEGAQALALPRHVAEGGEYEPKDVANMSMALMGMGTTGAAMGGVPKGSLGMFAGRGAKTADLDQMKQAESMLDGGADRADVWQQTGWMRGPDDKMRFEIDDSAASFSRSAEYDGSPVMANTADLAYDHPALFDAYPDARSIKVGENAPAGGGAYGDFLNKIDVGRGPQEGPIAMHEMQHALQNKEGFAQGGNSDRAASVGITGRDESFLAAQRAYEDSMGDSDLLAQLGIDAPPVEYWAKQGITPPGNRGMKPWDQLTSQEKSGWLKRGRESNYHRLAGEVEARNVQTRMDMTPEQRLAEPPWTTLDVPEADQIVRGATGGPQMSQALLPMDEASRMARAETSARDGVVTISKIETPAEYRGQGLAEQELTRVLADADKDGLAVALTPSSDFGANKGRLVAWYKKHGFVPNKGANKDFGTRETMIRPAKADSADLLAMGGSPIAAAPLMMGKDQSKPGLSQDMLRALLTSRGGA